MGELCPSHMASTLSNEETKFLMHAARDHVHAARGVPGHYPGARCLALLSMTSGKTNP